MSLVMLHPKTPRPRRSEDPQGSTEWAMLATLLHQNSAAQEAVLVVSRKGLRCQRLRFGQRISGLTTTAAEEDRHDDQTG